MPRRARLILPGIPWHIIQRGNNRSACFYTEKDYLHYLDILESQAGKHECVVHAYCLMTNHVHLLLTPLRQDSAALTMKHLGQRYAQYVNRTYERTGTLWEGRYRSSLVQNENYVLACYRYIELNPVRANMVGHPSEYRWSSYLPNAEGRKSGLLQGHPEYLQLGRTQDSRLQNYRSLFSGNQATALVGEIRLATNGNYALGNDRFKQEISGALKRRVSPGKPGRPTKSFAKT